RKLENIKDKVATGQATIQAQAEQMEAMLESLDKGAEAERQLRGSCQSESRIRTLSWMMCCGTWQIKVPSWMK
ncbi:MAG: hypothetical protein MRZ68_05165, partial [Lachnospira sp.]|nr:hypothetical protein [Lachnospira sp.]